jgi:hypothetical protein
LRERKMIWAGELRYVLPEILLLPALPLPCDALAHPRKRRHRGAG